MTIFFHPRRRNKKISAILGTRQHLQVAGRKLIEGGRAKQQSSQHINNIYMFSTQIQAGSNRRMSLTQYNIYIYRQKIQTYNKNNPN